MTLGKSVPGSSVGNLFSPASPWYSSKVHDDIEVIREYGFRHEIEQARDFLREQGIESIIWSDDAGGLYPTMGMVERYFLKVRASEVERALELLEEIGHT